MNEQDAPAHRGQVRVARAPSRQFFPFKKNRRAVDRVRAPASLKDIRATAEQNVQPVNKVPDLFLRRHRTSTVSAGIQKIDPAGHYQLAAAANESPNDYPVSLFRCSPQQARSSQIDALPNGGRRERH
jgi:hypothetical protein